MSAKTVTATVSLSTNPSVAGRYFIDVRDTTNGANRQMTTHTTDHPAGFLTNLVDAATAQNVAVIVMDETSNPRA